MGVFRATFSGTLGLSEQFAFGWAFANDLSDVPTDQLAALQTWLTTLLDTVTSTDTLKNNMHTAVLFSTLRVQLYQGGLVTGSVVGAATGAGTSTNASLPYEVSPAVSLTSTATGNTPKRGRFYLPPPIANVMNAGNGTFNTSFLNVSRAAVNAAFDQFNTADRRVGILRAVPGAQAFSAAATCDIGSVPDAQRRRRNKQVESRAPHVIV